LKYLNTPFLAKLQGFAKTAAHTWSAAGAIGATSIESLNEPINRVRCEQRTHEQRLDGRDDEEDINH
jgi:hypothetical protein